MFGFYTNEGSQVDSGFCDTFGGCLFLCLCRVLMSTASFFSGQAKLFPEPLQQIELLLMPVIFVILNMLLWIAVVGMGRRFLSDQLR
tara:strand:- start:713 stop:973 length:261 start_codon:yes stop_codon:yes gene_type:complete